MVTNKMSFRAFVPLKIYIFGNSFNFLPWDYMGLQMTKTAQVVWPTH